MIILAYDHGGFEFMKGVKEYLKEKNLEYKCFANEVLDPLDNYAYFTKLACKEMLNDESNVGVFCCRSGVGTAIMSNRFKKIRAMVALDETMVKNSRLHNNANVIVLPADYVSLDKAKKLIDIFLETEFEGGRHIPRVQELDS